MATTRARFQLIAYKVYINGGIEAVNYTKPISYTLAAKIIKEWVKHYDKIEIQNLSVFAEIK